MKGGVWESVVGGRGRPVKRHGGSCSIKDGGGAATTLCAGKGGGGGGSGYGIDKVLPYVCHILIIFFQGKALEIFIVALQQVISSVFMLVVVQYFSDMAKDAPPLLRQRPEKEELDHHLRHLRFPSLRKSPL